MARTWSSVIALAPEPLVVLPDVAEPEGLLLDELPDGLADEPELEAPEPLVALPEPETDGVLVDELPDGLEDELEELPDPDVLLSLLPDALMDEPDEDPEPAVAGLALGTLPVVAFGDFSRAWFVAVEESPLVEEEPLADGLLLPDALEPLFIESVEEPEPLVVAEPLLPPVEGEAAVEPVRFF